MLRELKFDTKDQNIWFTSDLHWNHAPAWETPIWKLRGFSNLNESNEYAIAKINELVKEHDILFSAGDLTLNCQEDDFENLIRRLNCQNIYCLWGNHPNPMAKIYKREVLSYFRKITNNPHALDEYLLHKDLEIYPFRYKNVIFLGHHVEMWINKQFITINHYPLSIWNYMKRNSWMLCGHSHHGFEGSVPDNLEQKILDIGWDGYLKPLSFNDVKVIMDKKQYVKVDEHH